MSTLKKHMCKNGINYTLVGDYYLPDIESAETEVALGKYDLRHKEYLRMNKPAVYRQFIMEQKLNSYLKEIDESADRIEEVLIDQLKNAEGIGVAQNVENQMSVVCAMNSIRNRAEEIVNNELIYT